MQSVEDLLMEIRENGVGEPQQGTLKVQKCWSPPGAPSKPLDGLKVFNSLSGTKVPFQTIDGTRRGELPEIPSAFPSYEFWP